MNRYTYIYRNICLYKVGLTEIIELTVFCIIFIIYKYIGDVRGFWAMRGFWSMAI